MDQYQILPYMYQNMNKPLKIYLLKVYIKF